MKNNNYFILISLFFCLQAGAAEQSSPHINAILHTVYGDIGLNVQPGWRVKIRELLQDIFTATPCQLHTIAQGLLENLKELHKSKSEQLENVQEGADNEHAFFTLFVVQEQINYLENYKKQLQQNFSFIEKLECSFALFYKKMCCLVKKAIKRDPHVCWEELVADRIFDYLNFERETILPHYAKLLTFLVATKKTPLPELLGFWSSGTIREKLIRRVKHMTPEITVQFLGDILGLVLQSYLMAGNSMYTQWLDEQDGLFFEEESKKQQKIQTDFQNYVNNLNVVQKKVTSQIIGGFKKGMEKIGAERQTANDQEQQEELYLFKAINLDYPIQRALTVPPTPYDQAFEASLMKTPPNHQWYNIYQYGDWEFDARSNSFWQNGLIPFGQPFWQEGFSSLQKPGEAKVNQPLTDPSRNSIFTEYISNNATYDIVVECTLINSSYPFFMGVMFNRGRWISADPERLWQYRLYGLYGNQTKEDDPSTRSINLCFAQQIIKIENNKEDIISPLQQIVMKNQPPLFAFTKADVEEVTKNPITYVFTITTSPDTVTVRCAKKGGQEFPPTRLNNLNSYLAIFGGIGFMAAGCQAEFKIIKPANLVYSAEDLKPFLE